MRDRKHCNGTVENCDGRIEHCNRTVEHRDDNNIVKAQWGIVRGQ